VFRLMPLLAQPARERGWQLGVNDESHLPEATRTGWSISCAAYSRQARMSSASR
jgi:hypothetical protein